MFGGDGGRCGVSRHISHLCETLQNRVHLTVVSDVNTGGFDDIARFDTRHVEVAGLRSGLSLRRMWRAFWGSVNVARGEAWDIIWLHARMPALLMRVALALRILRPPPGTRIMMSYHGVPFDPGHRRVLAVLSRWIEQILLRCCPAMHLVFLSEDMVLRLAGGVGRAALCRHRIHVLPNSSNLGEPAVPVRARNTRNLVITGRAGYQKNYALAARLMEHLPPDHVLTLCGMGTDDPAFQARILSPLRADTRARIVFAGPLDDVRPMLAAADCYILTSRYEGLPIGAIEAFETGLPLVLSPFEAAAEMVAAHPLAMVLPMRDLARDARRITRLIDEYLSDRTGHSARIRAAWRRKYPYEVWQNRVCHLVKQVSSD